MEIRKTITSIFCVPTLKIPRDTLKHKNHNFINGYIKDVQHEMEYENCIFLLFQPSDLDMFREFLESEYERTKTVIDDYDYPEGFVVVVYKLDERFKSDFSLIKQGKYSKTSESFQALFPKVVQITTPSGLRRDELSLQYRIFNKTEDLVKFWEDKFGMTFSHNQEIWQGFIEEDETLDLIKIKVML